MDLKSIPEQIVITQLEWRGQPFDRNPKKCEFLQHENPEIDKWWETVH